MSCIFLVFQVRKHFSKFVSSELQEKPMWFEFDGAPVK